MYVNMNRYVQVALRRFLIVAIVRILLQDISQQTIYLLNTSRPSVLEVHHSECPSTSKHSEARCVDNVDDVAQ